MNEEPSGILVGEQGEDGSVVIRVEGRGTHLNSYLLKQYLLQCMGEGRRCFQIDLSHCVYMDSTFLGMLAGVGIKALGRSLPSVQLLNPSERIRSMFDSLGIAHLFQVIQAAASEERLKALPSLRPTKEQDSKEMLEAHEKLVEVSPANEEKFRDVIFFLREKTKKSNVL